MVDIAKLSFLILQPQKTKNSIITNLKLSFEDLIQGALDQFRTEGIVTRPCDISITCNYSVPHMYPTL